MYEIETKYGVQVGDDWLPARRVKLDRQQQELNRNLVSREVIYIASQLVEDLLKHELVSIDDIENTETYRDDVELRYDYPNEYEEYDGSENRDEYDSFGQYLDEEHFIDTYRTQEIYEWWFVTDWLYAKLRGRNEPVLDTQYGYFWGRTTTGQGIAIDSVITQIQREAKYGGRYDE